MDKEKHEKIIKELTQWIKFLKECEEKSLEPCVVEMYEDFEEILELAKSL